MMQPRFFKYTATGNDFILIDTRKVKGADRKGRAMLAQKICHRRFGVGADGLVFLDRILSSDDKAADFRWDFFNSDGSVAEMCGNAARCVSLHFARVEKKRQLNFQTLAGLIETTFESEEKISVKMSGVHSAKWNQLAQLGKDQIHYDFVISGVPHAVVKVPHFGGKEKLKKFSRELKALPAFGKASTNVTFVRIIGKNSVQSMSFERGVENFTLSCGTGAVAAAYSLLQGEKNIPVNIEVPGGKLTVIFRGEHPILIGPAQFIADMEIAAEFLEGMKL
jgi:diaminopimelate epimerase